MVTKKRNQLEAGYAEGMTPDQEGYEVVTPGVTAVTPGAGVHNAGPFQSHQAEGSPSAFFRRTRWSARRLIST